MYSEFHRPVQLPQRPQVRLRPWLRRGRYLVYLILALFLCGVLVAVITLRNHALWIGTPDFAVAIGSDNQEWIPASPDIVYLGWSMEDCFRSGRIWVGHDSDVLSNKRSKAGDLVILTFQCR